MSNLPIPLLEDLNIQSDYGCENCGNKTNWGVNIKNEWSDLFHGPMAQYGRDHIIARTFTLECLVCHNKVVVRKEY